MNPLRTVLFVCTGNVCRSPMAEYLLRHRLGPGAPWRIGSAGLAAIDGLPASGAAVQVMREIGIDLTPHRSRTIAQAMIDEAWMVITMTAAHAEELCERFPQAADRVFTLASFNGRAPRQDIGDPIGLPAEIYRKTREEIDEILLDLILYLRQHSSDRIQDD